MFLSDRAADRNRCRAAPAVDSAAMADRLVMWDFDGTLAMRPGLWSGCLMEVLDEDDPGHVITRDQVAAGLRNGFPWHVSDQPHLDFADADAWWVPVEELMASALRDAGVDRARARLLARAARERFVDPSIGWRVYDDTLPALAAVRAGGWRNVILSNHVPELGALVAGLGLAAHVDAVFTSAQIGYEKPHPEAFAHVLLASGSPDRAWMVGDNIVADVGGAEAVGVPAILVRTDGEARHRALDVAGAAAVILAS
jgi:HAD superfamily hydrolase (TIGR01549 family)